VVIKNIVQRKATSRSKFFEQYPFPRAQSPLLRNPGTLLVSSSVIPESSNPTFYSLFGSYSSKLMFQVTR